jgi:hypothetical protein
MSYRCPVLTADPQVTVVRMPPGPAVRLQSVCSNKLHHCFMAQHGMAWHTTSARNKIRLTSGSHQARTRHHDQKAGKAPSVRWRQRQRIARRHRKTASQDGSAAQDKRQERKPDNDNDNMTSTRACGGTVDVDADTRNDTPAAAATPATVKQQFGCRARAAGEFRPHSGLIGSDRVAVRKPRNGSVMFLDGPVRQG